MGKWLSVFFFFLLIAPFSALGQAGPCPKVRFLTEIQPGLSDSERKLVCGDPDTDAWRSIPISEAEYFLKGFLQERGHQRPEFRRSRGVLTVDPGPLTRVTELKESGSPIPLHLDRLRQIYHEVLTPALLDKVENWSVHQLKIDGYPCPKVKTRADAETGVVTVMVNSGPQQRVTSIEEIPIPGLMPGILRRYDAFAPGDVFNKDLLVITENRVVTENLLSGFHLSESCGENGARIRQTGFAGPPRLLRVGFGINTEGLLVSRASWRNARLGTHASTAEVTLSMSAREQRLDGVVNWYHFPFPSRRSVRPQIQWMHQNEELFEVMELRGQLAYATTWDGYGLSLSTYGGPAASIDRTYRGPSIGNSHFISLDGTAVLKSNSYEYYAADPRSGFSINSGVSLADQAVFSQASVQRYALNGEALWNVHDFEPPLFIIGLRGGMGITAMDQANLATSGVPANYFQYLGGSTTLRGFGRQELPPSGTGLSSAYLDLEVRLSHSLPISLEPVLFYDFGKIGQAPWRLDPPLYRSPGFGIRWGSPVGVVRTTVAHGYPDTVGHWQFYLSLGEEF